MKKLTTKEFTRKAKAAHGNTYDYSKVDYRGWDGKIKIGCPTHGFFEQSAGNHLVGKGCPECAKLKIGNSLRSSRVEFISKAIDVHGKIYGYDKVSYKTARKPVEITCPIHGSFFQVPDVHLRGSGCPSCGLDQAGAKRKMSELEFIERAITRHNDKYDYSDVNYVNSQEKVTIICAEHGPFLQTPNKHLFGQGCTSCAGNKPLTVNQFVEKAKDIHGDLYSYESVEIAGRHTKVKIHCSEHGCFLQTPANHLKGHGCPVCGGRLQLTTSGFIEQARSVHGDRYIYDQTKYLNNKSKLTIVCPDHGPFAQTPGSHFAGNGCPSCAGNKKYDNGAFMAKARDIHGEKYDYNLTEVNGGHTNVTITCPTHGNFYQTPIGHLQGRGCPKCGRDSAARSLSLSLEEFVKRASVTHGEKYDLSQVDYVNNREKIKIICPEHGAFFQRAGNHLAGIGCPGCAVGGFDQTQPAILYYLLVETRTHTLYKIGITNRTVYERFFGEDAKKIEIIETWYYENGKDALAKEKEILSKFSDYRYKGKDRILNLSGDTELFTKNVLELET